MMERMGCRVVQLEVGVASRRVPISKKREEAGFHRVLGTCLTHNSGSHVKFVNLILN